MSTTYATTVRKSGTVAILAMSVLQAIAQLFAQTVLLIVRYVVTCGTTITSPAPLATAKEKKPPQPTIWVSIPKVQDHRIKSTTLDDRYLWASLPPSPNGETLHEMERPCLALPGPRAASPLLGSELLGAETVPQRRKSLGNNFFSS